MDFRKQMETAKKYAKEIKRSKMMHEFLETDGNSKEVCQRD